MRVHLTAQSEEHHLNAVPCRVRARVVVPQPDALQLSKGKMRGQEKYVLCAPFKQRFLEIGQVVGLTFPLCSQQGYRHLEIDVIVCNTIPIANEQGVCD